MSDPNVYAISDGKGQFLSSFSVHSSGKKGTSITFNFCETVAAGKRSAALIYARDDAARSPWLSASGTERNGRR